MPSIATTENYLALSAMITPALFLTANGSLIISTSNRMSRIVDRIRVMNELGDTYSRGATDLDFLDDRIAHNTDQLRRLEWRADRIRLGLIALYLGLACFIGSCLTLAFDVIAGNLLPAVPTTLAVVGVILLLGASINLVREALEALRSNRREIEFFRALRERRDAGKGVGVTTAGI